MSDNTGNLNIPALSRLTPAAVNAVGHAANTMVGQNGIGYAEWMKGLVERDIGSRATAQDVAVTGHNIPPHIMAALDKVKGPGRS